MLNIFCACQRVFEHSDFIPNRIQTTRYQNYGRISCWTTTKVKAFDRQELHLRRPNIPGLFSYLLCFDVGRCYLNVTFFHAKSAQSGTLKALGDLLRKHPESLFTNRIKGFELLYTGRYAYIGVLFFYHTYIHCDQKQIKYK